MRTNIVLDDDLLAEAMKYSKARSKRAVVREALVTYVTVRAEQERTASYRDRLAIVRRRAAGASLRKTAVEMVQDDRERRR
jgi:Arc/MetJ family transcription regulator